ncbi:Fic family protein [Desulfolithobacter dissulfuricans]|uniref:Fic family protein n=1 Tax=Desulfolithobacter dissulfuricans TaxID=2795293 RepID=UPI00338F039D
MNHDYDSHDKDHFRCLQRDFPVNTTIPVHTALSIVHARYDKLNTEAFVKILESLDDLEFPSFFSRLPLALHTYLFKDILSNADRYRLESDPGQGAVFFGQGQKFAGAPPGKIKHLIRDACSRLIVDHEHAVYNAVKFYQQFVMIHPFYDANGRIGRFMVEIYLNFHGIGISWEALCSNEKWIKKLNDCHKRSTSHTYELYIGRLKQHWEQFIFVEGLDAPSICPR